MIEHYNNCILSCLVLNTSVESYLCDCGCLWRGAPPQVGEDMIKLVVVYYI